MIRLRIASRASLLVTVILFVAACTAQQPARVVDLTAVDGVNLKATFFPAAKPGPGVLLLHQCNRQRKIWDDLARQLSTAGINVLTLDLRGFGESGGTPNDKLTPEEAAQAQQKWPGDIDAAFQYLAEQPGVKRDVIGVGGASCGVNNTIQTARRHPNEVKSLVLLSGSTDLNGRNFLRQEREAPLLFSVADDDEFPPTPQVIEWLFSITSNPAKKLVHYKKGGHGADMFRLHPELRDAIVGWYVTTLVKTPGRAPAVKDGLTKPQFAQALDLIEQPGGVSRVTQMLAEARRHDPKALLFPEAIVNIMGYEHLQSGDIKGAVDILKLNAAAFPDSPNVYDSVSDAYLADGKKDLARQNAKKALELLPSDTTDPEARRNAIRDSAQQKLQQLGDGQQ